MCQTTTKAGIDIDALPEMMAQGSEEAWSAFVQEFLHRLQRLFERQGLCAAEAEDLATDCVDHLVEVIHEFRTTGPGSFEHWVFRVAWNLLVSWFRARSRRPSLHEPEDAPQATKVMSPPDEPTIVAVREGMQQLGEQDRDILSLRAMHWEFSFAEIAEMLDIREGTARARYCRARKRMREKLEADPRCAQLLTDDTREGAGGEQEHE